jgi:thiol:disulfide interchange protein
MLKSYRAPDPEWLPVLKVIFGFVVLIVLAALAAIIALGEVKEASSYGLNIILGGLLTLAGGFASWAFRDTSEPVEREHNVQQEKTPHVS